MIVTICEDKNYFTPEENKRIDVKIKSISNWDLTNSFKFLDDYKDKLLSGEVYRINCSTDNGKYLWWSLSVQRPFKDTLEDIKGVLPIRLEVYGYRGEETITIKYATLEKAFFYTYKGKPCGSAGDITYILALYLHLLEMPDNIYMYEFNPERTKIYDAYEEKLWEHFKESYRGVTKEGVTKESAEELLWSSVANALKASCDIAMLRELEIMDKERKE